MESIADLLLDNDLDNLRCLGLLCRWRGSTNDYLHIASTRVMWGNEWIAYILSTDNRKHGINTRLGVRVEFDGPEIYGSRYATSPARDGTGTYH